MNATLSHPHFIAGLKFGARLARSDKHRARQLAGQYLADELPAGEDPAPEFDLGMFCGVVRTVGLRSKSESRRLTTR